MVLRHGAIVMLATFLVVSAWGVEVAHAIPCVAGTAASIVDTSCEIGDKLFAFGSFSVRDDQAPGGTGLFSANTIIFTPNAADPFAPGFTLSGAITQTSENQFVEGSIRFDDLRVTTLDGLSTIIGLNASVTGSTSINSPQFTTIFAAFNAGTGTSAAAGFSPDECLGSGPNCTDTAFFPSPVADTGAFGSLQSGVVVGGTANTATNLSASFFVLQVRSPNQVPEPSTLFLFGITAIGLFGLARWRGRSAKI